MRGRQTLRLFWEGTFFGPGVVDRVTRSLIRVSQGSTHQVLAYAFDGDVARSADGIEWLTPLLVDYYTPTDWHIRHSWVPHWGSEVGKLIVYQPLEYHTAASLWLENFQKRTDRIVVMSEFDREALVTHGISAASVSVIPPGVDLSLFTPQGPRIVHPTLRSFVYLWVGELVQREGLDVMLRAHLRAFRRSDDVTLLIYYLGSLTQPFEEVLPPDITHDLQSPDAPHVLVISNPFLDTQLGNLYRTADMLVAPYRGAAYQLPVLEALACGTAVLASDYAPYKDLVANTISGQVIEGQPEWAAFPGRKFEPDEEALMALLRKVRQDGGLYAAEKESQPYLHPRFTLDLVGKQWKMLFADTRESRQNVPKWASRFRQNTLIWKGPVRNASGYAAESRLFLKNLTKCGVVPRVIDESSELNPDSCSVQESRDIREWERTSADSDNLMLHNVISTPRKGSADVLRTMFETDRLPDDWIPRLLAMDGIIVASRFNVETFSRCGIPRERLHVVPGPIQTDLFVPRVKTERERFQFISVFDWTHRKGWDVLVRAWAAAFSSKDPVELTVKTTAVATPDVDPEREVERILSAQGSSGYSRDPAPIQIINEVWGEEQVVQFYQDADVFVLPTRGEGWGRPILEAMSCELPVITTLWSGPADYLTMTNSLPLVVKRLEPVPGYAAPWLKGGYWAEPDYDQLVYLLRYSFEHYDTVRKLGIEARKTAQRYEPVGITAQLVDVLRRYGLDPDKTSITL